ncbi:MAG: DUF4440 domain-containing protein [Bradyrhizobiaceae bacterium]|nr:DUF4440 domain-containing protein [Bradyrhizobiaceae bacterium]
MPNELRVFFDAYRDSFPEGAAAIAAFYAEPCMTARAGVVRVHATRADLTALFAGVDRQYRARGYVRAEYEIVDHRVLGANAALATVRWAYKSVTGETIWETTFSYNLYRRDGAWKILVQTMHDD